MRAEIRLYSAFCRANFPATTICLCEQYVCSLIYALHIVFFKIPSPSLKQFPAFPFHLDRDRLQLPRLVKDYLYDILTLNFAVFWR